jgi:hypothetical protein
LFWRKYYHEFRRINNRPGQKRGQTGKAQETARAMKNKGITVQQISMFTNLSIEEIEKL